MKHTNKSFKKKILLLGAYGRRNIGDDIFLKVLLDGLKGHDITFNCWRVENLPPEIDVSNKKVISSKLSKTTDVIRAIFHCDIVLYGGGELWMRLDGSRVPNLSTYKMLIVNLIARMIRKEVVYLSVGAENLGGWGRLVASWSAKLATQLYLRDNSTAAILGIKKYHLAPDIAYLYQPPNSVKSASKKSNKSLKVAVCATRLVMTDESYNLKNIKQLASAIKKATPHAKYTVISAMTDENAVENDGYIASKLQKEIGKGTAIYSYHSIDDMYTLLSTFDLVISYRLHIGILAHLANASVVGIGYKPKIRKYFESYSVPQAFCGTNELKNELGASISAALTSRKFQQEKTSKARKGANKIYNQVFRQL